VSSNLRALTSPSQTQNAIFRQIGNNPSGMSIRRRVIVVGLVWNDRHELLFCKMSSKRGVFPEQWGLPGGGVEPNEKIEEALRRELREEIGIEVKNIEPSFFKDGQYEKTFADGSKQQVYMIFLMFSCIAQNEKIKLNDEFSEYRWVKKEDFMTLDLNVETIDTLVRI